MNFKTRIFGNDGEESVFNDDQFDKKFAEE